MTFWRSNLRIIQLDFAYYKIQIQSLSLHFGTLAAGTTALTTVAAATGVVVVAGVVVAATVVVVVGKAVLHLSLPYFNLKKAVVPMIPTAKS